MKNSIQIVLFFEKNEIYNPSKVASLINEEIDNIGNPIILPINSNGSQDSNFPIIIFNQSSNINLTANFFNISISLYEDMLDKYSEVTKKIFKVFKNNKFIRIGTIFNRVLNKNILNDLKNDIHLEEVILNSKDFKISWLNDIEINNININLWKNYFTDKTTTDDILCVYDFNTKFEDKLEITKEFALEFFEQCKNIK